MVGCVELCCDERTWIGLGTETTDCNLAFNGYKYSVADIDEELVEVPDKVLVVTLLASGSV